MDRAIKTSSAKKGALLHKRVPNKDTSASNRACKQDTKTHSHRKL